MMKESLNQPKSLINKLDEPDSSNIPVKREPQKKNYTNNWRTYNLASVGVAVIALAIIVIIGIDECRICLSARKTPISKVDCNKEESLKTFWVYGLSKETAHLSNVFHVLNRLGYVNDPNSTDWDLLWAHDYPFRAVYSKINNLKPHQKINHFPGCGYLTNKVDLAISGIKYIPPAFKLPDDKEKLLKFAKENTDTKFVEKDNNHRHIHIRNLTEINLDINGTFVQKFVDKPLLVDGYKFDIGIYTIITSIDPLRVYIYNGDALLRFCPIKYYPFDSNNINKYVVGDDYLPTWDVPSLTYYYKTLGFGMRESLNAFLRAKGKKPEVIWSQIEDSIRTTILAKESLIANILTKYKFKRNFFEMMRFDFVVDENLTLFLMEANMSPNLSSSHFAPNKLLYEQVLFNLFGLIGLAPRFQHKSLNEKIEQMQSAEKNIAVFPIKCSSDLCKEDCLAPVCQLCQPCLSLETKQYLLEAHREHLNRGDCKRVFPPSMMQHDTNYISAKFSSENQIIYSWFQGKCNEDSTWCI